MTVDGDDGDGRATDGRRMRRTAWWCGSAGAAEGGSAGSMWRFEKSFSETLEHRHMVHHDVRRGRATDGRTGAADGRRGGAGAATAWGERRAAYTHRGHGPLDGWKSPLLSVSAIYVGTRTEHLEL